MTVAGIICEFNPLHSGHAYLMAQLRQHGADAVVCAMSGNFVQRGEPALVNKLSRAEMAVSWARIWCWSCLRRGPWPRRRPLPKAASSC